MNLDAIQSVAPSTSSSGAPPTERKVTRPTKPKVAPYLSGPVPMSWLAEAVTAGGSALALGVSLWFQRGMRKRFGPILRVDTAVRKVMNLTADQSRRAVTALAARGLIHVHTGGRGRCTEVEILNPPGSAPSVDLRKPRDDARRGGAGQAPWHEPYDRPPTTQRDADAAAPAANEGVDHE
ncbi:MAG: hypothetical protein ACKO3G_14860 [Planctomycetaceae bacterium]